MTSRFGPRTTRAPRARRRADRQVGVAGDQRRDQGQQRGQVGRQVDVHVGQDRRRPNRSRPRAAPGRVPCRRGARGPTCGELGRQLRRDHAGVVGAGVVGDRDPERVGELARRGRRAAVARTVRGRAPRCRPGSTTSSTGVRGRAGASPCQGVGRATSDAHAAAVRSWRVTPPTVVAVKFAWTHLGDLLTAEAVHEATAADRGGVRARPVAPGDVLRPPPTPPARSLRRR